MGAMRILAAIIALQVFFASAVPCCTIDECEPGDAEDTTTAASQDECGDSELCSPFFLCKSCAGLGFSAHRVDFIPVLPLLSEAIPSIVQGIPSIFNDNIWRPPKVS
jgi:hypothetical protein